MKADLHSHTSHSDGTKSVREVLEMAQEQKIKCLAITDHDNLSGSLEALEYSSLFDGILILGMEISTKVEGRTTHMLAYFPKITEEDIPDVYKVLSKIKNSRQDRMREMIKKAQDYGYDITYEDVISEATKDGGSSEILSRPHFARILVEKGIAKDIDEAFTKLLREGKPLYASRFTLSYREWIKLVHDNGGVIIWAHPLFYQDEDVGILQDSFEKLLEAGIDGIELEYPYNQRRGILDREYIEHGIKFLTEAIHDHNLLSSSGGDYHGDSGVLGFGEISEETIWRLQKMLKLR